MRAVLAAEDLLARAGGDPAPHWAALTGPAAATVASHTAKTFTALGEHIRAEAHYTAAAASRDPAACRRIVALNLAQAAEAQAAQGHADRACATWDTALTYMTGVTSNRHRQAARSMRAACARSPAAAFPAPPNWTGERSTCWPRHPESALL